MAIVPHSQYIIVMTSHVETLTSDSIVSLPKEAVEAIGLHPGEQYEVLVEGDRIVVQPSLQRKRPTVEEVRRIVRELQDMNAGQPSLEDEYFATRDKDKW